MGTVRIPPAPRRNGEVLKWAAQAHRALLDLRDRLDQGQRTSLDRIALPAFWVSYWETSGTYQFHVMPGYVTYQNMGNNLDADGPSHYMVPTLGGVSLEQQDPKPTGTLGGAVCYVYVRATTDAKGVINGTPTVVSSTSKQASIHHVPPDDQDSSGTDGDYYFLLAEFEADAGGNPTIKRRITGNRNIPNQLIEVENIGTGKKLHRDYLEDNDDKHELRTIIERASQPQIKVKYDNEDAMGDEEDAEEILIEGNGYDNTAAGFVTAQTTVDGLVTTFTDKAFGYTGTVTVPDVCGINYYDLEFEDGLLVNVTTTAIP